MVFNQFITQGQEYFYNSEQPIIFNAVLKFLCLQNLIFFEMKYRIWFLFLFFLLFSCKKEDTGELLTGGKWKLVTELFSDTSESLEFFSEGTYQIDTRLVYPRQVNVKLASLTGRYQYNSGRIDFLTTVADILPDTGVVNLNPYIEGNSMGSFFGYLTRGIFMNDSSMIDSAGNVSIPDLRESGILESEQSGIRTWRVNKLTEDSLVVLSEGQVIRYFRLR